MKQGGVSDTPAVPSEIARLVREAGEAYRSGGYDAILPLLHPEGHAFIQEDLPNGGRWEGREGFAAMLREWNEAWEEFGYDVLELEEYGHRALTHVRQHGVARGSGMPIDMELYYVWGARDRKIDLWHLYLDRADAEAVARG